MTKTRKPTNNTLGTFLLIAFAGSVLAACGSRHLSQGPAPSAVQSVQLQTVGRRSSPVFVDAVGTVQSVNTSVLSAQIGGMVREIRVKPGDRVRRGEVLALLDDRTPRAQLSAAEAGVNEASEGVNEIDHGIQAAQANLRFARSTFERYEGLMAKNSISRQEFDDAHTRYKEALANEQALEAKRKQVEARQRQARSQASVAETLYSYSRVVSPLNGVVVTKAVDTGTVVMPGAPLLTVEDNSRYRLEASVPENVAGNVRLGQLLAVSIPEGDFEGRVTEIVPVADPSSRTFTAKVDLPPNCKCRSGEYGKVRVRMGAAEALFVPQSAVIERGELEGAFVAGENNILHFRLVTTGRVSGGQVEILSGLNPGERVAVSNVDRLRDGERVEGQ